MQTLFSRAIPVLAAPVQVGERHLQVLSAEVEGVVPCQQRQQGRYRLFDLPFKNKPGMRKTAAKQVGAREKVK